MPLHHCEFCGKEISTRGGVKKHILARSECRRQWNLLIEETSDIANNLVSPPHYSHSSPEPDNSPARKIRRVNVEEVADEEDICFTRYFEECPDAGWVSEEGQTTFERYQQYKKDVGENEWAPFSDSKVLNHTPQYSCGYINSDATDQGRMGTC
jgi:hypothetical protein